jgi:hypothetical protein
VALDGDPHLDQVMPPPVVDTAGAVPRFRLAATTRFVRELRITADGSQVARMACGQPFGQCVLDVLTITDGSVRTYEPPEQSGELAAIGDGVMLGNWYCNDPQRCVTEGLDLASGAPRLLTGRSAVVDESGHLVMLQMPSVTASTRGLFATNLDGTDLRLVFASDWSVRPISHQGADDEAIEMELPWGWVAVSLDRLGEDGGYDVFRAAVRLSDGGWVRLVWPWNVPFGGAHD